MTRTLFAWALALLYAHVAFAQFGFFDQMFGGGGGGGQHHNEPQNVPSDSAWYRGNVEKMHCDKYFIEDKVELAEGHRLCVSRGGFKDGESARKIELARKGLL
ncbi:Long chronological lifespan protein 2 [Sporothrix stenoceras]